jgi:ankyrin repeat protein
MAYDRSDIRLLLGILLVLSCGVGLLYSAAPYAASQKSIPKISETSAALKMPQPPKPPEPIKAPPQTKYESPFVSLTPQKIVGEINFLQPSRNVKEIANALTGLPIKKLTDVIDLIMEQKSPLTSDDKLELLFALAAKYPKNDSILFPIFDRIDIYENLRKNEPVLYIAAHRGYATILPYLVKWAQGFKKRHAGYTHLSIEHLIINSLRYAVEQNDTENLEIMLSHGVPITQQEASELLWTVVKDNKDPGFVGILLKNGADINYVEDGYSPLIKAVENKNFNMVRTLILETKKAKKHLDINAFYDPAIGTALQLAIEKGLTKIDAYLRKFTREGLEHKGKVKAEKKESSTSKAIPK